MIKISIEYENNNQLYNSSHFKIIIEGNEHKEKINKIIDFIQEVLF